MPIHGTYFSTFPFDVLAHVLRYSSTRPMHSRWQLFVSPHNLTLGSSESHPLESAVRADMMSLHAHYDLQMPLGQKASGVQLPRIKYNALFKDLLDALGGCLPVLTVSVEARSKCPVRYRSTFVHCTSMLILYLGRGHSRLNVASLLRACGHCLRELHMISEYELPKLHLNAITRRCKAPQLSS